MIVKSRYTTLYCYAEVTTIYSNFRGVDFHGDLWSGPDRFEVYWVQPVACRSPDQVAKVKS